MSASAGRTRVTVLAFLAVVLAAAPTGCRSKEPGRFYDDENDFSIKLPEDWETIENFMGMRVVARSPLSDANDKFQESVGVVVEKLPKKVTLDEYMNLATGMMKKLMTD